jgi:hypothetical protein
MRSDRGRVSVFLAVGIGAVLVVIGLTYDGAGRLRAYHRADSLAAEAARAGGQAIDVAGAIGGGAKVVSAQDAVAAAQGFITKLDEPGVTATVTADDGATEVEVVVTITYDTVMLDLFGFADTYQVTGEATVELHTTTEFIEEDS